MATRPVEDGIDAVEAELESLVHGVVHDLGAPLRAMRGFAEGALAEADPAALRAALERSVDAANRLHVLLAALDRYARLARGPVLRVEVDVARVVATLCAAGVTGEIPVACTADAPVRADPTLLRGVLVALLDNARRAVEGRTPATIRVETRLDGGGVRLCVSDDGVGFASSQAGRLFQPFQRLHRGPRFTGPGMSLAGVRRVAHRHGGEVAAEGVPDAGACFSIWFPS